MTEINLFDEDEPLAFKHILIYPYPDLKRLWVRIWLPARQGAELNVELRLYDPAGRENNSLLLLAQTDVKLNNTFHVKDPIQPGAAYWMTAELSTGFGDQTEVLDRQEFEVLLEFRDPEAGQPGFGIGLEALFSAEEEDE
jgi:hypothetical protein